MVKKCLFCKTEFEAKRESAKYCSDNCRVKGNYKRSDKPKDNSSLLQKVVSVMKVYNCDIDDIIDVFVASKKTFSEPKTEKATQQSSIGHKAKIAELRSEMEKLGTDWVGNARRKKIKSEIAKLESEK